MSERKESACLVLTYPNSSKVETTLIPFGVWDVYRSIVGTDMVTLSVDGCEALSDAADCYKPYNTPPILSPYTSHGYSMIGHTSKVACGSMFPELKGL